MNFSDLLSAGFQLELRRGNPDSGISLIFSDSRQAGAGDIFCVYEDFGEKTPDYLNSCFERGVRTVLMKEDSDFLSIAEKFENLILTKEDPRELHGPIAHFISGEPSLSLRIVAVTGTNGKTSVTHILFDLFS
ncbi:MAG: hypothetical protein K8R21_13365, partial [Leptospira sp.]|nr:hypothetical protein [Leptospira sp.]